jgi:hypothetical protein
MKTVHSFRLEEVSRVSLVACQLRHAKCEGPDQAMGDAPSPRIKWDIASDRMFENIQMNSAAAPWFNLIGQDLDQLCVKTMRTLSSDIHHRREI